MLTESWKKSVFLYGLIVIVVAQWLCKPRVGVRFSFGPPRVNRGVGESGRPRQSHKLEIAGSNPASATKYIHKHMIEYIVTFFAVFFTDIFYTYYLKAVQDEQVMRASMWAAVVFLIACVAVINYTTNYRLLIPAAAGAFCGTWVGMKLRKNNSV